MEVLTGEEMRSIDRRAIEGLGIPAVELMKAAGGGVAEALLDDWFAALQVGALILCGKGNNGGDGFVVARQLAASGIRLQVVLLARSDAVTGAAALELDAARGAGIEVREVADDAAWAAARRGMADFGLVVDAVLGTGGHGAAQGLAAAAIHWMNGVAVPVVAVDVPSGLDAGSHRVPGPAVRATRTYTLCRPKVCLVLEPAAEHAGPWTVVPIGIPAEAVREEAPLLEWLDASTAAGLLPGRVTRSHKGSYGHLLVVAGSRGKAGAAVLAARGALRAGVGLITVATPRSSLSVVAAQQAEMMTEPLPESSMGRLSRRAGRAALDLAVECDALAIGPGLGTDAGTRDAVLEIMKRRKVCAVLDADGLNALAMQKGRVKPRIGAPPCVLTPHPGEAARLLGWGTRRVEDDRLAAVRRLARRTGSIVVLKGHRTLVADADGRVAINASGNPGMATAGCGDVLTGVVGAFLARGIGAWDAARLAVWAHGAAGDRARMRLGEDGLIASDVAGELPGVLRDLAASGRGRAA